jgi:integrase
VAELVTTPKGKPGRPSKAMTFDQAMAMLEAAKSHRLHGYVVVSLLVGIRTEEARALLWSHVVAWVEDSREWKPVIEAGFDHERFAIYVWRSVRAGGDTKTERSRRTLELPSMAGEALREHRARQAKERLAAGQLWKDHGLVFASQVGTPLDASHVRRAFRAITKSAMLGENWTPRELRHSFVSIMVGTLLSTSSDDGMLIEQISQLAGHSETATTETIYRHQIRPVVLHGAEAMDRIFPSVEEA